MTQGFVDVPTNDAASATAAAVRPRVVCAGLIAADMFVPPLQRMPEAGELVAVDDLFLDAGGCAANTATTLARLGVPTSLAAKVGSDTLGDWLRTDLADKGVGVAGMTSSKHLPTSKTVILPVANQDRRYVHASGANAELTATDIRPVVDGVEVLAVGGYLALPGLRSEELARLFAAVRDAGGRTVLDVVVPRGATDFAEAVRSVLPFVDCFVPNEDEATALTGEDQPDKQADVLLGWGCASVVVTCGAQGVVYVDADQMIRMHPPKVNVVDASGAGDAFTAGMIYGLLRGWAADKSLRFATAVGASACRGLGCTTTVYTGDEALAAIADVEILTATRTRSVT